MITTRTAKIKIVGKETSKGFFGGKTYTIIVTVEGKTDPLPVAVNVPIGQYYSLVEGKEYNITMYQHSDGRWHFKSEF